MEHFTISSYDEETGKEIVFHYYEKNGRFFVVLVEGSKQHKARRISEKAYISAIEEYYNA